MAPTPLPLDSGGSSNHMDGVGGGMGGQISLGMLIQYINQRTYSDLLNLAEILPRKADLDKKIFIVQFAQRTRQLYVRLLALVKWAASASKVDKCCHITVFLEKQNNLIIDTADKLFHMTKENLVIARLPHFHIPAAVETLTTGSYDRLPLTIRQRILPPEPITSNERKHTLTRLEQIVQHRLVTTELLPQMRTSKIENGRVRFTVDHEFEVSLTLMSDSAQEPWRLLEVDILVEDRETGEGKALVHPLQVGYIHQLVQSRLQDNPNPLLEVYTVLHSFCQSLQLEVLYAQTLKLLEDRLDYHIRVEEYLQGKSLTLTYWRELTHRDPNIQLGYRLTVQVDPSQHSRPLMLLHTPSLGSKESEIAERAIRSDQLSIERLLIHTIYLRTKARLTELKQEIDSKLGTEAEKCIVNGSPAVLHAPILQPCFRSEQLLVAVDTHTGVLLAHVPQYESFPRIKELQNSLNQDKSKLDEQLSDLRFWMMVRRTEKTLQHLEATVHERLPLMYGPSHPLHTLSKHKLYISFHRHPNYVLIVEFHEKSECCCEVDTKMYLVVVKEASIEDNPEDDSVQTSVPKSYLRVYRLMPLDPFVCTHGPTTKVEEPSDAAVTGKRKVTQVKNDPLSKRIKAPAYFLRDIAQVVAVCDQVFPLEHISSELQQVGVRTSGVQVEEGGMGAVVRLVDIPYTKEMPSSGLPILYKHLLSATVRTTLKYNSNKSLVVEYVFTNCPVSSMSQREQSNRRPVSFVYEAPSPDSIAKTVQAIVSDFMCIIKLYELVLAFARCYNASNDSSVNAINGNNYCYGNGGANIKVLSEIVKVRSFNYKTITLSYGPNYDAYVRIKYHMDKKAFKLIFGMMGCGVWATNAHTMLGPQLEDILNRRGEYGLVSLVFLLHNTYQPLLALSKLQPSLHTGAIDKCHHAIQIFTVVAHSATRVHIFYRNVYCLEVDCLPNGLVSIRDGAFSSFQTSRAIEEFTPIKGLKAFLNKYVDESAICRRRSQSEDDNPPTPVPLDDSPWPTPKPSSPARHGPITPPVSSNPHTPASPHPGGVSGGTFGPFSSSPAAAGGFSLASPPSIPSMNPSPAMISHPSPSGGFLSGSSPSGQGLNVASPGFPTPSPVGGQHALTSHSPASSFLAAPSNISQVSRMLPNRPYAAAIPTVLTHDAFHALCSPPQVDHGRPIIGRCCVLEQFLGSTYINRSLQMLVRNTDTNMQSKDPSGTQIKLESLIATFILETTSVYTLTLKVQPTPEFSDKWTSEELQALELLFNTKASCPPYKPFAIETMYKLLHFPFKLLKDCVKIIQLEMFPQQQAMKWNVNWCLTVPALGKLLIPPGNSAVLNSKSKYLFYIQITRSNVNLPPESEPTVLVLPIVHDMTQNKTHVANKKGDLNPNDPGDRMIQTVNDFMSRVPFSHLECSIYPCLRELLFNFSIGIDSPPVGMPNVTAGGLQQQQAPNHQQGQQPTPSSVGVGGGVPSASMASPHQLLSSPHSAATSSTGGHLPAGTTNSTATISGSQGSQVPHYQGVSGPGSHMQGPAGATQMGMNHPQAMGNLQGPMGSMGGMTHSTMGGGLMQGAHAARGTMQNSAMQNMSNMQSGMQGQPVFSNNMMGQFPR